MRETFPRRKATQPTTSLNAAGRVTFNVAEFDKVIDPKGEMTQVAKAALLGVPESVMSLVVNGKREPNTAFIAAVRRAVSRATSRRHPIERFFTFDADLDEAA